MKLEKLKKISNSSGVYIFRGSRKKVLYIGRATCLKSRVRSYFSSNLAVSRGPRLVEALENTKDIETIETDSVLDAYLLEANLIKKYEPKYNVVDKDNKSFQFVCITREDFPCIVIVRGRELEKNVTGIKYMYTFGPFPRGNMLRDAMKVLRKIFPYRDKCSVPSRGLKPCFNRQLYLCPGVCTGEMDKKEYMKRIREIKLFFDGKKKVLLKELNKDMKEYAKNKEFEKAASVYKKMYSLKHIQDVSLIKREYAEGNGFRIEAYDTAHTSGKQVVGVMVVFSGNLSNKKEYRVFNIKTAKGGDDVGALKEILNRRFSHPEWVFPDLVVIDGGKAQLNACVSLFSEIGLKIPVVSVVKDDKHKPMEIIGNKKYAINKEEIIIKANSEAHRFSIFRHREIRNREFLR